MGGREGEAATAPTSSCQFCCSDRNWSFKAFARLRSSWMFPSLHRSQGLGHAAAITHTTTTTPHNNVYQPEWRMKCHGERDPLTIWSLSTSALCALLRPSISCIGCGGCSFISHMNWGPQMLLRVSREQKVVGSAATCSQEFWCRSMSACQSFIQNNPMVKLDAALDFSTSAE